MTNSRCPDETCTRFGERVDDAHEHVIYVALGTQADAPAISDTERFQRTKYGDRLYGVLKAIVPGQYVREFPNIWVERAKAALAAADATRPEAEPSEADTRLRERHVHGYASTSDEAWNRNPICTGCGHAWPCDTAEALELLNTPSRPQEDS